MCIRDRGDIDLTANGPLFAVPAGDASMTVRVGGSTFHRDNEQRIAGLFFENDLSRTRGSAGANLDLPVSRRNRDFSALGNLTPVSYTHLRAHETPEHLVCRL